LKKKKEIKVKAEFKHKIRLRPKRSQLPHSALLLAKEVYWSGSVLTSWLQDKFKGGSADKQKHLRKTAKPITKTNGRMRTVGDLEKRIPRKLFPGDVWDGIMLFYYFT
jgi:hypothetical protein